MGVVSGSAGDQEPAVAAVQQDFAAKLETKLKEWDEVFQKFYGNKAIKFIDDDPNFEEDKMNDFNFRTYIHRTFTLDSELVDWEQTIYNQRIEKQLTKKLLYNGDYMIQLYKTDLIYSIQCILIPDQKPKANRNNLYRILETSTKLKQHNKLAFMILANIIIKEVIEKNLFGFDTATNKLKFMTWINKKLAELDANEQKPHN